MPAATFSYEDLLRREAVRAVGHVGADFVQSRSGASSPASVGTGSLALTGKQKTNPKRDAVGNRKTEAALLDLPLELNGTWLEFEDDGMCDKMKIFKAGHTAGPPRRHSLIKHSPISYTTTNTWSANPTDSCCLRRVVDPSNPKRIWWDSCGVLMIGYDVIFIPLTIFNLEQTTFFTVMSWVSLLFWSIDVPSSFFVGFHDRGRLEMRPRQIAIHYLRTFFFVDVMLICVDVVVLVLEKTTDGGTGSSTDPSGIARVAKSYRMMRILRGLRLIRLVKLPQAFSHLCENIQSDSLLVIIGVVKHTIAIMMLNHLIACMWFAVCSWGGALDSWVVIYESAHRSKAYLYCTALHWSFTQFTPASMEVNPVALHERIFAIVVIIFALVTFSSFISSITNAMNTLHMMNNENVKAFAVLQRYFRSNSISLSLCVRVRRHVEYKLEALRQAVHEKDVKLLRMLNTPLQIDLHYEVYSVVFKTHAFFVQFDQSFQRCMKMMCHDGVHELHVSEGDAIFCRGDPAKKVYTITAGETTYVNRKDDLTVVKQGEWLAEAGLWTTWVHHGQAQGKGETTIVSVDTKTFLTYALENRANTSHVSHYAVLFVEHLNTLNPEDFVDLSDPSFNIAWATHVAFMKLGVPDAITEAAEEDEDEHSRPANGAMFRRPSLLGGVNKFMSHSSSLTGTGLRAAGPVPEAHQLSEGSSSHTSVMPIVTD